jgi:hypothetical protein
MLIIAKAIAFAKEKRNAMHNALLILTDVMVTQIAKLVALHHAKHNAYNKYKNAKPIANLKKAIATVNTGITTGNIDATLKTDAQDVKLPNQMDTPALANMEELMTTATTTTKTAPAATLQATASQKAADVVAAMDTPLIHHGNAHATLLEDSQPDTTGDVHVTVHVVILLQLVEVVHAMVIETSLQMTKMEVV